mmetsp:Transcript_6931/g.21091  ORF Transcript_6931/g.21091 Transcript_6931/m.21091 type:complete len:275 (+) Transcript_6931:160-984(+)
MALRATRAVKEAGSAVPTGTWRMPNPAKKISQTYTLTGGSGEEHSHMMSSLEEIKHENLMLYHRVLSSLRDIRERYALIQSEEVIRGCIRHMFLKYKDVKDVKIASMLNFKGRLDLQEVNNEFKGPEQVNAMLADYEEKLLRERQAQILLDSTRQPHADNALLSPTRAKGAPISGKDVSLNPEEQAKYTTASVVYEGEPDRSLTRKEVRLMAELDRWHKAGVVPEEVKSYDQFLRWSEDQDKKFEAFATEAGILSKEDLQANKKQSEKSNCTIM